MHKTIIERCGGGGDLNAVITITKQHPIISSSHSDTLTGATSDSTNNNNLLLFAGCCLRAFPYLY